MIGISRENNPGWSGQTTLADYIDDTVERIRQAPEAGLRDVLAERTMVREFEILKRRFGIDGTPCESLAAVARTYGLTRERIRQIERETLNRFRLLDSRELFQTFLKTQTRTMLRTIVGQTSVITADDAALRQNQLTGLQRVALTVAYGKIENWLDRNMEPVLQNGRRLGWITRDAPGRRDLLRRWLAKDRAGSGALSQRILQVVRQSDWPLAMDDLRRAIPDVGENRLRAYLRDHMNAIIDGDTITAIADLTTAVRLVLVLRRAGCPLHVRDIQARYRALFGATVRENAARVALQRQADVIILARGVYALYEHLPIASGDFAPVADAVQLRLAEAGQFMSAKVLHRNVSGTLPARIAEELTPYLLLGICRKDPRFAIRRGLMIGLADGSFPGAHVSLNETIVDMVREHGPISIAGIRQRLSDRRDVLGVSINVILKSTPEIVPARRGLYGVTEQVIGDVGAVERLQAAIRKALEEGPAGPDRLAERLRGVGFDHDPATILSLLRHMDGIALAGRTASLTNPDSLAPG